MCIIIIIIIGLLVHWSIGLMVHWSIGPLVHWTIGTLDHWSIGPLVHWSIGLFVNWSIGSTGPLVQWSIRLLVNRTIGPLDYWSIGPLVHFSCTFRHCPSEHLLSICNFPFSIGLFVTYSLGKKNHAKIFLLVKICFMSYMIIIQGQMEPLKKLHLADR